MRAHASNHMCDPGFRKCGFAHTEDEEETRDSKEGVKVYVKALRRVDADEEMSLNIDVYICHIIVSSMYTLPHSRFATNTQPICDDESIPQSLASSFNSYSHSHKRFQK